MREITTQLYSFDELSDEAKKVAIDRYRENMDWDIESEMISESFAEKLNELGYPTDEIEWSLNHRQGDGVAFYGNVEDVDNLVKRLLKDGYDIDADLFNRIIEENLSISVRIQRNSFGHHYSHFNTMDVEIDSDYLYTMMDFLYENLEEGTDEYEEKYNELDGFLQNLKEIIETDIKSVSRELERNGYEEIDYYSSNEAIIENIRVNEFEFTKDGIKW